jgi:hypothetical protein
MFDELITKNVGRLEVAVGQSIVIDAKLPYFQRFHIKIDT